MRNAKSVTFLAEPDEWKQNAVVGYVWGDNLMRIRRIEAQIHAPQWISGRVQFEDGSIRQFGYCGPFWVEWAEEPLLEE